MSSNYCERGILLENSYANISETSAKNAYGTPTTSSYYKFNNNSSTIELKKYFYSTSGNILWNNHLSYTYFKEKNTNLKLIQKDCFPRPFTITPTNTIPNYSGGATKIFESYVGSSEDYSEVNIKKKDIYIIRDSDNFIAYTQYYSYSNGIFKTQRVDTGTFEAKKKFGYTPKVLTLVACGKGGNGGMSLSFTSSGGSGGSGAIGILGIDFSISPNNTNYKQVLHIQLFDGNITDDINCDTFIEYFECSAISVNSAEIVFTARTSEPYYSVTLGAGGNGSATSGGSGGEVTITHILGKKSIIMDLGEDYTKNGKSGTNEINSTTNRDVITYPLNVNSLDKNLSILSSDGGTSSSILCAGGAAGLCKGGSGGGKNSAIYAGAGGIGAGGGAANSNSLTSGVGGSGYFCLLY